jgi:CIC family chloride channel protein
MRITASSVSAPAGWRDRLLGGYFRKWVVLGVLIGVLVGGLLILFAAAIDAVTRVALVTLPHMEVPLPRGEGAVVATPAGRPWLIPIVVAVGGLVSAVLVYTFASEAEGGGTDASIEAFHHHGGRIRARVPPFKLITSAIVLGSGGSAGREGPSAQIGAGIASWLGDVFHLSARDRRTAVAVGIGAGIGTIFKAPLGGAILGAEMLYLRDFEPDAIVPGFIASVVGYSVFSAWYGFTPIFGAGLGLKFDQPEALIWYALLGVLTGLVAIAYARVFYRVRDMFRALRLPRVIKPALGGLAVGLIALGFPQVLSMGYGWVQMAIDGNTARLAVETMLVLVPLKILATSLTIGSGGSGGDFAPVLYVGAMLGGGVWGVLHGRVPGLPDAPAPFVIVAMMALLGAAAKSPLAVILMVAEMTGEFSMLVPAMVAATLAYLVSGDVSLYDQQMPTRADSPAHRGEYTIPLIQAVTVGEAMRRQVVTVAPSDTVAVAEQRMAERGLRGLPVVEDGRLVGMFTASDALRARQQALATVGEAMTSNLVVAYPADSLHTALQRMTRAGVSRLPVVERERPDRLIGVLSTRDLAAALDLEVSTLTSGPERRLPIPEDDPLRAVPVQAAMSRRFETVPESTPLKRVANRLAASGQHAALVVDDGGAMTGIVTLRDLESAAADDTDRPVGEIATRAVVAARPSQSVAEALAQPGAEGLRQLPVVELRDGRRVPVGLLRRSDVVAAYLRGRDRQALIARRARTLATDHAGGLITLDVRVDPGGAADGRSLAELQLPRESLVTAVLRDGAVLIPRGDIRLQAGDRVRVLTATAAREAVLSRFDGAAPAITVRADRDDR